MLIERDAKGHFTGSKYVAGRDIKLIAADVRKDIAAAILADELPAIGVAVQIQRYAGGQSLTVRVKSVPSGFEVANGVRVAQELCDPHGAERAPFLSDAGRELISKLE